MASSSAVGGDGAPREPQAAVVAASTSHWVSPSGDERGPRER